MKCCIVTVSIRSLFVLLLSKSQYLQTCWGVRYRSWLRHYATSRKVAGSSTDEVDFSIYVVLPAALWSYGVDSASNRNEYQESS
jgi:hypothetical protein